MTDFLCSHCSKITKVFYKKDGRYVCRECWDKKDLSPLPSVAEIWLKRKLEVNRLPEGLEWEQHTPKRIWQPLKRIYDTLQKRKEKK